MTICCLPLWLADDSCAIEEGDFKSPFRSPRNDSEVRRPRCHFEYKIPLLQAAMSSRAGLHVVMGQTLSFPLRR